MEQKQRFFIYDRKEMAVLILLGVMVALFSFTLGVHLGKKVGPHVVAGSGMLDDNAPVATTADKVPGRQDLNEQAKVAGQATDETLNQAIHDEVTKTGIKLETPLPVELPKEAKSAAAGAMQTTKPAEPAPAKSEAHAAAHPSGRYTLQIGSHPSAEEAKDQVDALGVLGMRPFMQGAEIKGKGKWYRVFIGGYETREEAEKAGEKFKSEHVIDTFIVAKMPE